MQPVTKRYMALLSIVGIGVGIYVVWSWLFRQRQNWSPHELGVLVVLTVLCILCRCLPLYVRDDCTIDMSFISILAVVLLLGPEAAVAIIFLTTPLEVIPTEDGKGFYHIFNTAPSKLLFNTANLNLSMAAAGVVYHAVGGVPGKVEAAERAGLSTVLIPQDNRMERFEHTTIEVCPIATPAEGPSTGVPPGKLMCRS